MSTRYLTMMFYIFAFSAAIFIASGFASSHYGYTIFGSFDFLHHEFYAIWCFVIGVLLFLCWHFVRKLFASRDPQK